MSVDQRHGYDLTWADQMAAAARQKQVDTFHRRPAEAATLPLQPCPHCGTCPTCGRRPQDAAPVAPAAPPRPWWAPIPPVTC